nr:hypothetical protein [Paenibacillus xylanexedens]
MKLIEIAQRIDKAENNQDWVDTQELGKELGLDVPWKEQDRIKSYWIGNWYCTDTYVGWKMYFFDDKPVAVSSQLGRKSNEEYEWFNLQLAKEVKEYLLTLILDEEESLNVSICDINEEIGNSFKISFNGQILNKDRAVLNGEKVEILEEIRNKPYGIDDELKIKLLNGDVRHVNVNDLDFSFHLVTQ